MDSNDNIKRELDEVKARWKDSTVEDFKQGDWFGRLIRWMLESYARQVDAEYIRQHYPGLNPASQAKRAIKLAARHTGIAGAISASGMTALELSSLGPQALITVPAAGTLIVSDIAFCTRTQLRTTFDLSVIHGAPLAMDDVEDCYFIFQTALGVKAVELAGRLPKEFGPKIIAYNVRKLLRSGVRKALQEALKKASGTAVARKLTERAMMRLLVPGVSVPLSYFFNSYFTKKLLTVANQTMYRRGRVVQPLVRLYKREPQLPNLSAIKALITVIEAGHREDWSDKQVDALRYCQRILSLDDTDLAQLDQYFDRGVDEVLKEFSDISPAAMSELTELMLVAAALAEDDRYDAGYGAAIAKLSTRSSMPLLQAEVVKRLSPLRASLH